MLAGTEYNIIAYEVENIHLYHFIAQSTCFLCPRPLSGTVFNLKGIPSRENWAPRKKKKNLLTLSGIETPIFQPVAQSNRVLTEKWLATHENARLYGTSWFLAVSKKPATEPCPQYLFQY
jgi:hypothetical protein